MIIRACDLETTGKEATDEVVELAHYDVYDGILDLASGRKLLVKPARPIPATASAIHHITDADVVDAPAWNTAWRMLVDTRDDGEELKFAAHVASFEQQWLAPLAKVDWIDTWKCSLRQWPDLEGYSLHAVRYALDLQVDPTLAMPPHRALPDSYVCAVLLLELLKYQTVETLVAWSAAPAMFTKFDFGQFDGKPLSVADVGYLEWIAFKSEKMSEDWRWNAKREIARRAEAKAQETAAARKAYCDQCLIDVPGAATVRDLENWWFGQADHWAKHGILTGSPEYETLKDACAARKKVLLESGQPQFEGAQP